MRTAAELLRYVNIALLASLAVLSFRSWLRGRGRPGLWVGLTFAALALFFAASAWHEVRLEEASEPWLQKLRLALAFLVPYFLFRFTVSLAPAPRALSWFALALTAVVTAWGLALPELEEGARSLSLQAFIVAGIAQWTALTLVVAARLWRASRGQPTVARNRMRLLSVASLALNAAILLAGVGSESAPLDLAFRLLVLASALLFLAGFVPPAPLRDAWRRTQLDEFHGAIVGLMRATTEADVAEAVLPHMASLVGARAVTLLGRDGEVKASYGTPTGADGDGAIRREFPFGTIVVWTSPYAPFFGEEEFRLLESLGALTDLALDRARLFSQEREARAALEEADELKTNFIALASHELRTPAAVVHGIAATLHLRGDDLRQDQVHKLRRTLYEQTERLTRLVDQLLDLSRLEAQAIPIRPEPIRVRSRLDEVVATAAGERAAEVEINVPPDLDATVDPAVFDRIVSNLVTNAFRYGRAPVRIAAEQRDRHFRVTVEDRGPGVEPEFVPHLFERFTRNDDSRGRAGGTGLGLAIAQSYAHAHGGELLYARADPQGARFELVLPTPFIRAG